MPAGRDARAAEAALHAGGQRRQRHAEHHADRDLRDHVGRDRDDRPHRGGQGGRRGDHRRPTPGGRRRAAPARRVPRLAPSPDCALTVGTVRRDAQRDGDRGAAVVPPHRRRGAHHRRHHRRAGRAQARCSSPPTGRSRGRPPRSRPPCCSTRSSIASPCTSGACPAVLVTFLAIGAIGVGTAYLVFDEVEQALDRLEAEAPEGRRRDRGPRRPRRRAGPRLRARATRVDDAVGRARRAGHRRRGRAALHRRHRARLPRVRDPHHLPDDLRAPHGRAPPSSRTPTRSGAGAPPACSARPCRTPARRCCFSALRGDRRGHGGGRGGHARSTCPAPSAVGFTAGVLSLFPHVGLTLGCIPLLLLTLGFRSLDAWRSCCSRW